MDKLNRYQNILVGLLEEIAQRPYANTTDISKQVVADTLRHHYQLINIGWHKGRFVYAPLLHFDLLNNKVWVQQNGTELEIGDELVERGIEKSDIVLGFIPKEERALTGFAVA